MKELTKHYLISGRVQGVGFRAFTYRAATQLKIKGWVRNLSDGRVETMAQATPEILILFEAKLKTGPTHGEVESILITEVPPSEMPPDFSVRKDSCSTWSKDLYQSPCP